jgi:hypothetical protein
MSAGVGPPKSGSRTDEVEVVMRVSDENFCRLWVPEAAKAGDPARALGVYPLRQ